MSDSDTTEAIKVPTVEEAREELQQLNAWLQDLDQRAQRREQVLVRSAFLTGVLASQPEPAAPEVEKPKPTPAKRRPKAT